MKLNTASSYRLGFVWLSSLHTDWPALADWQDIGMLIAMPHKAHLVAAIDPEKGTIFDIRKKHIVRTVAKWTGGCTKDGKYGLYAPSRYALTSAPY